MADTDDSVYTRLGVRPIINAAGNQTVFGGSSPSDTVRQAMETANRRWAVMEELMEGSGDYMAGVLGVESAYVTSGCAAAMVLSAAACIAGSDPDKVARLPNTTGMSAEIVVQKGQRWRYDRNLSVPGATLAEAGDDDGCTREQLAGAIGPSTAAVGIKALPETEDAFLSVADVVAIAHEHGVPVIVDAASQIYPLDYFRRTAQSADLVCFAAKYMGASHSTGFVCGRHDLIEAVAAQGFIGFETGGAQSMGRGFKVDRQNVIGAVAALEAWFTMNHEDRLLGYDARLSDMRRRLQGLSRLQETRLVPSTAFSGSGLHLLLDTEALGKTAHQLANELLNTGTPGIRVGAVADDTIRIGAHTLQKGDDEIIVARLRELLTPEP